MVENRPWLTWATHAVLVLGVAVLAFPIYVTFVASTHTLADLVQTPMPLLPGGELVNNYLRALNAGLGEGAGTLVHEVVVLRLPAVTADEEPVALGHPLDAPGDTVAVDVVGIGEGDDVVGRDRVQQAGAGDLRGDAQRHLGVGRQVQVIEVEQDRAHLC